MLFASRELSVKVRALQTEVGFVSGGDQSSQPGLVGGHLKAHKVGVIVILTAKLQQVGDLQKKEVLAQVRAEHLHGQDPSNTGATLLWSSRNKLGRIHHQQGGPRQRRTFPEDDREGSTQPTADESGKATQQQVLEKENDLLLAELESTGTQASALHRTLVEISSLNEAFSTQIQEQSEQLEHLYEEALVVTDRLDKGNVELGKALRYNKEGGRYVICIILFFTFALLFFDWWNS